MERFDKDVSVVFPCFNEEENVEALMIIANAVLQEIVRDYEIIVVNDGSSDRTGELAQALADRFERVRVLHQPYNKGYGVAIRDGFAMAKYDLLFFSDADRQFDLLNLTEMLPHTDTTDIIVGYRKNRQDKLIRKILSRCYNILVRTLFGISVRDIDCAFKIFHKRVFEQIEIESTMYFINTEVLAKAAFFGFSIKEVGVHHLPRMYGNTKVGIKEIPFTLKELVRIRRQIKSLKRKHGTSQLRQTSSQSSVAPVAPTEREEPSYSGSVPKSPHD